jgi:hypothetical protein
MAFPGALVATDEAALLERCERDAEALVADAKRSAETVTGEPVGCGVELGEESLVEIVVRRFGGHIGKLEAHVAPVIGEDDVEGIRCGGSAMLDADGELVVMAADVECRVRPSVEVAGAAKSLAGGTPRVLPGVMDDDDGDVVLALHLAEEGEERGDFRGAVFVDAMKADEGVEQEKARSVLAEGAVDAESVAIEIETQRGGGDDVEGDAREGEASGSRETEESLLDVGGAVFRHVDEGGPRIVDGEAAEAGGVTSNGQGQIEAEPALAALRRSADDADAGPRPEGVDEPAAVGLRVGEVGGADDRERVGVGHAFWVRGAGERSSSTARAMMGSSTKDCSRS